MLAMMTNLTAFASFSLRHFIAKSIPRQTFLHSFHRSSAGLVAWTMYA